FGDMWAEASSRIHREKRVLAYFRVPPFYGWPFVPPPVTDFVVVLLARVLFGFLATEAKAPEDFPDMRQMVLDPESFLDDFRDAGARPKVVQVTSLHRSRK